MLGILVTDLIFAAALAAAFLALPTDRRISAFAWICLAYGTVMTFPIGYESNDAIGYAAGGVVLLGAVLLGRSNERGATQFVEGMFYVMIVLAVAVVLDEMGLIRGLASQTYQFNGVHRASGLHFNPIPAGEVAAALLGLAVGMSRYGATWRRRLAWLVIPITAAAVVSTMSRGAILGAILISGAALWLGFARKRRGLAGVAILAIASCVVGLVVFRAAAVRSAFAMTGDSSAEVRLTSWAATPSILVQHPWGGVQNDPAVLTRLDNNSALNFFGQMGLVGGFPLLILAAGLVATAVWRVARSLRRPIAGPRTAAALALGAWLIAEQFSPPIPYILSSPFLWAILGLALACNRGYEMRR